MVEGVFALREQFKMKAYLVVQLRRGDIVVMHKLFAERQNAFMYMFQANDSVSSWWKVVEVDANLVYVGNPCEIVLDVAWDSTNRVKVIGVYPLNQLPPAIKDEDDYFVETLVCE